MNRNQRNSNQMGTSVSITNKTYAADFATNVILKAAVKTHDENQILIADLALQQQQFSKIDGLIHDKNMMRTLNAINAMRIVNAIKAYAVSINNQQLIKSVPYSAWYLRYKPEQKVLDAFLAIRDVANANAAAILPFGATAPMLSQLTTDTQAFQDLMEQPKAMRANQVKVTNQLKAAFLAMTTHLRKTLDALVRSNFSSTDDYYMAYFNARVTYNIGNAATTLRGRITDPNGHHIKQALVELQNYPTPGESTMRLTDTKGYYSFKRLDLTTATITVKALNYTDGHFTKTLLKDKDNELNMQLTPAPLEVPVLV